MSKTISGECCSGGGGGGGVGLATDVLGGGIGQVLYQSNANDTTFTNAVDGVLQSNGTVPSFSALSLAGTRVTDVLPLTKGGTGSSTLTGITGTGNLVASSNSVDGVLQSDGTTASFGALSLAGTRVSGVLPLTKGGTGSATLTGITGTGNIVASNSPQLVTPNIGTAEGVYLGLTNNSASYVIESHMLTDGQLNVAAFDTTSSLVQVGQSSSSFPGSSSVAGAGVLATISNHPVDIIAYNTHVLRAQANGKLRLFNYPSADYLYTTATGVVESGTKNGTGNLVATNSPQLETPNIGAATGTTLTLTNNANIVSTNSISTAASFNLAGFNNTLGDFYVGQGNVAYPPGGSNVIGRGTLWTNNSTPIDIVPNSISSFTAKTDGKLKFYQHADGSFLRTDSTGNVEAVLSPAVIATMTSIQSITQYVFTKVQINQVLYQRGAAFVTLSNRFVAPLTGIYQIQAYINIGSDAGEFALSICKGASNSVIGKTTMHIQSPSQLDHYLTCSCMAYFAQGDYAELFLQSTASTLIIEAGVDNSCFMINLVP